MYKLFSFSLIVIVSTLALTGCAHQSQLTSPPPQHDKVIVLLDWFPNTNHTGLYVARDKGFFREQGLDVTLLQPEEGSSSQLVAIGKADFAVSSQEGVTQARAEGIPVVSIAAIIQHNTSAFASLKSAGIVSVKDFEGKRYGGWGSPIEEAVLTAVMGDAGADFKKVKNITIGTTDFFSTIGRESDFQWIFYGWDGVEAERREIELNTIMLTDLNPVLDYYTPVIITGEQHVREQNDMVKRFMTATVQGYEFTIAHPQESADILINAAPEINAELVKRSQAWLSPRYQADATQWGIQKVEVWEEYAKWLFDRKLIQDMTDVRAAFTNEFLPSPVNP